MLKVNVSLSRKLSRDYNSTGFSINLEGEIPFSINEPDAVLDHIGEFYDLADKALAQQIDRHQNPDRTLFDAPGSAASAQEECPSVISFPPPNGELRATAKQMKYLGDLSQKLSLTPEALDAKVAEILGQTKSHQQLSRREAGTVIAALVGNGDAG
jgi:hypothetical protein